MIRQIQHLQACFEAEFERNCTTGIPRAAHRRTLDTSVWWCGTETLKITTKVLERQSGMVHCALMAGRRVAVITGGTRGIGKAVSLAAARDSQRVYAIYARNWQAADAFSEETRKEGLDVRCIRADLTKDEDFSRCVNTVRSEAGRIDVIVHSAVSGVHRPVTDLTERHIAWTFNINFLAIHRLLREFVPLMPAGGRIIGLTSAGANRSVPRYAAVGASKGALESLFRYYAAELAPRGISVNLVCPGLVLTDTIAALPQREALEQAALARTPSGRLTTPEDVAQVILFLCSEAASQIVGQTIVVDGGFGLS
ncbi:MAG: enoyl-ACP reductase [Terriglobia bacterium]|nr:MAG: enoyl-ACP reductase [Terriglobia bacterium]